MEDKMVKFAAIFGHRDAQVRERPMPEIGDDEVLIKNMACNICTHDYQQWLGLRDHQGFPMAGGHEHAGMVVKVGKNVDSLKVGDKVGIMLTRYCGECENCREGKTYMCKKSKELFVPHKSEDGYYGEFNFSTYTKAPAKYCFKFYSDIPYDEAGFLEPMADVVRSVRRARIQQSENVVIIGGGTMGLLNAQVARAFGARVIISELLDKKIEKAKELGFTEIVNPAQTDFVEEVHRIIGEGNVDVVIICVGNTKANEQAIEVADMNTRIVFYAAGYPAPELKVDSNLLHYKCLELIGTIGNDVSDFQLAAKMLDNKAVNVNALIEKRFPLDDIQAAYELAATPGSYRVSVHAWDEE